MHGHFTKNLMFLLFFVAVSAIGGGAGYFVVSEWVMPHKPQGLRQQVEQGQQLQQYGVDGASDVATKAGGVNTRTHAAKKKDADGLPRKHQWITEAKIGPYRQRAVRIAGVNSDGSPRIVRIGMGDARRGFAAAVRNSVRRRVKAPIDERWAQLVDHSSRRGGSGGGGESSEEKLPAGVFPGDVYLSGIPMINQGQTAYCAVASAARVLQNYGIDMTMEDMAELAGSSELGGTHPKLWADALGRVANSHGLELKTVAEVTETEHPIQQLLYDYNQMARDMGYEELNTWDYANAFVRNYAKFDEDREYAVQREVMLSNDRACEAFEKNVTERIDESDPLFWTVTLGDVPEKGVMQGERGSHMRLIIGYNEKRGEILYSDSWGEGHELKRMDGQDALSITRGMYYLTD